MKNLVTQLSLGTWAALAVGMGIMSRSWETFFSLMAFFAFFSVGAAASAALHAKRAAIRWAGVVGNVVFVGVILGGLLAGGGNECGGALLVGVGFLVACVQLGPGLFQRIARE